MDSSVQSRLDTLLRDLREGTPEQRQHAAKALRDYGAAAVEPLCLALRDKDLNVRVAAAESLGLVGDERAVRALMEALRECLVGRSAKWQIAAGILVAVVALVVLMAVVSVRLYFKVGIGGIGFYLLARALYRGVTSYYERRRDFSGFCEAVVEALRRIAERSPAPELRKKVVPELKAIAADVLQQQERTRTAARFAAWRIEALTEHLKSLPRPAAASAPDAATLPRAVDTPTQETERLPRVRVNE